jgi:hypothetical protein
MIIKEAKYNEVLITQSRCVEEAVYGCDECGVEITDYPNEESRLEVTVFHSDSEDIDHLHFCSWDCVLKFIPKIDTDYFVSLPFILFDSAKNSPRSAYRLIEILKDNEYKETT